MDDPNDCVVDVDTHEFEFRHHRSHRRRDIVAVFVPEQKALFPDVLVGEVRAAVRNNCLDLPCLGILRKQFECYLALGEFLPHLRVSGQPLTVIGAVELDQIRFDRPHFKPQSEANPVDVERAGDGFLPGAGLDGNVACVPVDLARIHLLAPAFGDVDDEFSGDILCLFYGDLEDVFRPGSRIRGEGRHLFVEIVDPEFHVEGLPAAGGERKRLIHHYFRSLLKLKDDMVHKSSPLAFET